MGALGPKPSGRRFLQPWVTGASWVLSSLWPVQDAGPATGVHSIQHSRHAHSCWRIHESSLVNSAAAGSTQGSEAAPRVRLRAVSTLYTELGYRRKPPLSGCKSGFAIPLSSLVSLSISGTLPPRQMVWLFITVTSPKMSLLLRGKY